MHTYVRSRAGGRPGTGIFSVFDGRAGAGVADFAAKHLHDEGTQGGGRRVQAEAREENLDQVEEIQAAMIRGFLATDGRLLAEGHLRGGATATTAYLRGGRIWVANVGDCRAR